MLVPARLVKATRRQRRPALLATLLLAAAAAALLAPGAHAATVADVTSVAGPGEYPAVVYQGTPKVFDIAVPGPDYTGLVITVAEAASNGSASVACTMRANLMNSDAVPAAWNADYVSEPRTRASIITIYASDFQQAVANGDAMAAGETDVRCAVYHEGPGGGPLEFSVKNSSNIAQLAGPAAVNASETLFALCCMGNDTNICDPWKQANLYHNGNAEEVYSNLCGISGNVCTEAGDLLELNLRGYGMSCDFPSSQLFQFTQLQAVYMGYNDFTGNFTEVADGLVRLNSLKEISLVGNGGIVGPLSTDGTDGVCRLKALNSLNLNSVSLTGTVPECLFPGFGVEMVEFQAANNKLTGTLPAFSGANQPFKVLNLASNQLTGLLPEDWNALRNIVWLDLSYNQLNGTVVPAADGSGGVAFEIPATLTKLILNNNKLTGAFPGPQMFMSDTRLEEINLSNNQLTELPSTADGADSTGADTWDQVVEFPENKPALTRILLANNTLQGKFPLGFGGMGVVKLDISNNQLSGPLPTLQSDTSDEFDGFFATLLSLNLDGNQLTGGISEEWGQAGMFNGTTPTPDDTEAWLFSMQNNKLTGAVPEFMSKDVVQQKVDVAVRLAGNNFTNACDGEFGYTGACPTASGPPTSPAADSNAPPPLDDFVSPPADEGALPPAEDSAAPPPSGEDITMPPAEGESSPPPSEDSTSPAPEEGGASPPPPEDSTTEVDGSNVDVQSNDDGSLSGGAKAGIAIGVILLVVGSVTAFVVVRKRRHGSGANPLSSNRFERFNDSAAPPPAGAGGWQPPPPQQAGAWGAYNQQQQQQGPSGRLEMAPVGRANFEP